MQISFTQIICIWSKREMKNWLNLFIESINDIKVAKKAKHFPKSQYTDIINFSFKNVDFPPLCCKNVPNVSLPPRLTSMYVSPSSKLILNTRKFPPRPSTVSMSHPVCKPPVVRQLVVPFVKQPVVPVVPVCKQPVCKQPVCKQPVRTQPVVPICKQSVVPVSAVPICKQPVVTVPVCKPPVVPVCKQPIVTVPVCKLPVVPVCKKPVKHFCKSPVVKYASCNFLQ